MSTEQTSREQMLSAAKLVADLVLEDDVPFEDMRGAVERYQSARAEWREACKEVR